MAKASESSVHFDKVVERLPKINGIPVFCSFTDILPIEKAVPNPRNPNKHPDSQIELLAKIIKGQGWRTSITVSRRSGYIVRGHARWKAANLLGLESVPVDYQDYGTEAQEWADLIADNRVAELANIDFPMLKDLLTEIDTGEIDMDLTGFTAPALEELMTQYNPNLLVGESLNGSNNRNAVSHTTTIVSFGTFAGTVDVETVDRIQEMIKAKYGENMREAVPEFCRWLVNENPFSQDEES